MEIKTQIKIHKNNKCIRLSPVSWIWNVSSHFIQEHDDLTKWKSIQLRTQTTSHGTLLGFFSVTNQVYQMAEQNMVWRLHTNHVCFLEIGLHGTVVVVDNKNMKHPNGFRHVTRHYALRQYVTVLSIIGWFQC